MCCTVGALSGYTDLSFWEKASGCLLLPAAAAVVVHLDSLAQIFLTTSQL